MDDNAEDGILRAQMAGKDGVRERQKRGIAFLDERIMIYLVAIGFLALLVIWATAKSPLVVYGSVAVAIGLTLLWGYSRIKRIEKVRAERVRQVEAMRSDPAANDQAPQG